MLTTADSEIMKLNIAITERGRIVRGQYDSIDFMLPLGFIIKSSSDPDMHSEAQVNTNKFKTRTQGAPEMGGARVPRQPQALLPSLERRLSVVKDPKSHLRVSLL
ncbi:unnamed protein product [Boreogadus saida]